MNPPTEARHSHLSRLSPESYRGQVFIHWTMTFEPRATGWLNPQFHVRFREIMLHSLARYSLVCPVYCLMPDHLHLVWAGVHAASDQRLACAFLRTHLNRALHPDRLQRQAYDHVLRADERRAEAFASLSNYILLNPVRAKLC